MGSGGSAGMCINLASVFAEAAPIKLWATATKGGGSSPALQLHHFTANREATKDPRIRRTEAEKIQRSKDPKSHRSRDSLISIMPANRTETWDVGRGTWDLGHGYAYAHSLKLYMRSLNVFDKNEHKNRTRPQMKIN